MKQEEKINLILKELYDNRTKLPQSINKICTDLNIPLDSKEEPRQLGKHLENSKGFIIAVYFPFDCHAKINTNGIDYVEGNLVD